MDIQIPPIKPHRARTIAEQVFGVLHEKILTLELAPGTEMSEVEISRQMQLSRQPVREAFSRQSQLGFLQIRPQRVTIVRQISQTKVLQAMYIRCALETEVIQSAIKTTDTAGLDQLSNLLSQQKGAVSAGNNVLFLQLDDAFHRTICEISGARFVWKLIREQKAHMDRVHYLVPSQGSEIALGEHSEIFASIESGNTTEAVQKARKHLSRIKVDVARIRQNHEKYFTKEED